MKFLTRNLYTHTHRSSLEAGGKTQGAAFFTVSLQISAYKDHL